MLEGLNCSNVQFFELNLFLMWYINIQYMLCIYVVYIVVYILYTIAGSFLGSSPVLWAYNKYINKCKFSPGYAFCQPLFLSFRHVHSPHPCIHNLRYVLSHSVLTADKSKCVIKIFNGLLSQGRKDTLWKKCWLLCYYVVEYIHSVNLY